MRRPIHFVSGQNLADGSTVKLICTRKAVNVVTLQKESAATLGRDSCRRRAGFIGEPLVTAATHCVRSSIPNRTTSGRSRALRGLVRVAEKFLPDLLQWTSSRSSCRTIPSPPNRITSDSYFRSASANRTISGTTIALSSRWGQCPAPSTVSARLGAGISPAVCVNSEGLFRSVVPPMMSPGTCGGFSRTGSTAEWQVSVVVHCAHGSLRVRKCLATNSSEGIGRNRLGCRSAETTMAGTRSGQTSIHPSPSRKAATTGEPPESTSRLVP